MAPPRNSLIRRPLTAKPLTPDGLSCHKYYWKPAGPDSSPLHSRRGSLGPICEDPSAPRRTWPAENGSRIHRGYSPIRLLLGCIQRTTPPENVRAEVSKHETPFDTSGRAVLCYFERNLVCYIRFIFTVTVLLLIAGPLHSIGRHKKGYIDEIANNSRAVLRFSRTAYLHVLLV
jgi:hypothetical protein